MRRFFRAKRLRSFATTLMIAAATLGISTTTHAAEQQVATATLTTPNGTPVELPRRMEGSWDSKVDTWSGWLYTSIKKVSGSTFEGKIEFANSDCTGFEPFTGVINNEGNITILAKLGGSCGDVTLILSKSGNMWVGTYDSPTYPDNGRVSLSAR